MEGKNKVSKIIWYYSNRSSFMVERGNTTLYNIIYTTLVFGCFFFNRKTEKKQKEGQKVCFGRDLSNPGDVLKPSIQSQIYSKNTRKNS